jgi:hypothetical protein
MRYRVGEHFSLHLPQLGYIQGQNSIAQKPTFTTRSAQASCPAVSSQEPPAQKQLLVVAWRLEHSQLQ